MKFGKRLRYDSVVEWEDKYIAYHELKGLISMVITQMKLTESRMSIHGTRKFRKLHRHDLHFPHPHSHPPHSVNSSVSDERSEGSPLLGGNALEELGVEDINTDSVKDKNMIFFRRIAEEAKKVNDFFTRKEAELQGYYHRLVEATEVVLADPNPSKLKQLKTAFVEFYRGLCMLENYVELNCEGFRKILKKHEKLTGTSKKEQGMEVLYSNNIFKSTAWREMMTSTENLYAKVYQLPRADRAKIELIPTRAEDTSSMNMFKLGVAVGICIALVAVCIFLFIHGSVSPSVNWNRFIAVIPVYRAVLIPLIAVWLWGVNVYIWTRKRINYIFIFGLNPRTTLDYRRIFKTASILTAVWLASFFMFVATVMGNLSIFNIRPEIYPLALIIFNLALVLFPFRALHRKSRFILFITIYNVIISPFGNINFMALYVGDVLTSLVKTLFDFEYTICYYATGDWLSDDGSKCTRVNLYALPVLSAFPYFWRLLQCLKRYRVTGQVVNLGNAGKYTMACLVVIFGGINGYQSYPMPWTPFRVIWLILFIFATIYNYTWDVLMDWGLGRPDYKMLRKQLLYKPHTWAYYYVIFSNLLFRFAWTAYITPTQIYIGMQPEFFATLLAFIEIFRRFTWSIFRVENEQLVNIGENRAVTFVSLPTEEQQNVPKVDTNVSSINGVWVGRGPFDVIIEFLQRNNNIASP